MKKFFYIFNISFFYLIIISNAISIESDYFKKGIELFQKKEFDESKILFERDIVFDPKSEKSYLYLAKIFSQKKNDTEEEINLKNVLLINPQNDEAIYMFALLRIKQSDYRRAKELIDTFSLVCKSFCSKKNEIKEKFEKLNPENGKNNN